MSQIGLRMKTERLEVSDVEKIYELLNEAAEAINSENVEGWRALFCDDSLQAPPEVPLQSGNLRNLIGKPVQSDQVHSKLSFNPEVVRIFDDHAYTYGFFKTILTIIESKDKSNFQRDGKFLFNLEKQIDGSWKILVDCFNYNEIAEL